jgi:hypothetical protein
VFGYGHDGPPEGIYERAWVGVGGEVLRSQGRVMWDICGSTWMLLRRPVEDGSYRPRNVVSGSCRFRPLPVRFGVIAPAAGVSVAEAEFSFLDWDDKDRD